jgi:tetratricopeptide (TPR) repeat protein
MLCPEIKKLENWQPRLYARARQSCDGKLYLRKLQISIAAVAAILFCASTLLAQTPSHSSAVAADMQQAQAALHAHDAAKAQQMFQAVLKLDPANADAHANLGVMDFLHGKCAAAEPHFRAALHANPALIKMKALLSVCEKQLGQSSAQADMESAFAQLKDPTLRVRLGLELANLDYGQGELEQTASVLHALLNLEPDNIDILFFAQRVYSELANDTLNKLAVLAPGSARMEQLIAERLINAGDLKDATTHYEKALQIDPHLPGVHFELAEALMQASPGNAATQTRALQQLHDAIQTDGDSANIECELGRIALLQSGTEQALAHYRSAYRMNPGSAEAQMGMAGIFEREGKDQQAAIYLRKAVASEPFNAEAHYRLSQVDKKLHLADESQKQLKLFLDIRSTGDKVKQLYREMNPAK